MIGLGSDKQCKMRWSLKNPDQKGSFKFQQEGPQWVCDMVRLWSDLGAIKQCLHQRHRLRRRPLLPLHPSLSRQLAGWWHDAGGAADDDGDAILMMMLTWWIWHYVGAIEQLAFFCQAVISWSASEGEKTSKMKIAWSPSGPQSSQGAVAATCFWRDFCNGAASRPISEVLRKLEMNPSKRFGLQV